MLVSWRDQGGLLDYQKLELKVGVSDVRESEASVTGGEVSDVCVPEV